MLDIDILDLDIIKERLSKTTSGPWHYDGMHYEITAPYAPDRYWVIASECRSRPDGPYECDEFGHEFDPTFDFIASARTDVEALVAEVEKLRAHVKANMQVRTEQRWIPVEDELPLDYELVLLTVRYSLIQCNLTHGYYDSEALSAGGTWYEVRPGRDAQPIPRNMVLRWSPIIWPQEPQEKA